jgi:hypothetical protein
MMIMEEIVVPESLLPDRPVKTLKIKRAFDSAFKVATIERFEAKESVVDICNSVGISKGVIYKWIKDKDKIRQSYLRSTKYDDKVPIYRVKSSTFEDVSNYLGVCLSNNWSLTTAELRSMATDICNYLGIETFKASMTFISNARRRYFDSLFPDLFIAPSQLRYDRQKAGGRSQVSSSVGDGLFTRKEYRWGHPICHFIGDKIRERDYLDKVKQGKTLGGYAIRVTFNQVQFEDGTKDYFVIDCYHHMVRRECLASKSNSSTGPAKWLKNGKRAITNTHIEIISGHRAHSEDVHNVHVYLNAGRKALDDELENRFQSYKAKFLLKSGSELLWDYGDEYKYCVYPDVSAHQLTLF